MSLYWLLRREYARYLWRHRRVNIGQFMAMLDGAPAWLARDTTALWAFRQRKLRRLTERKAGR